MEYRYKMLERSILLAILLVAVAAKRPRLQNIAEKGPTRMFIRRTIYAYLADKQCSAQISYPDVLPCIPKKLRVEARDYNTFPDVQVSNSLRSATVRRDSCDGKALVNIRYTCKRYYANDDENQLNEQVDDRSEEIEDQNDQIEERSNGSDDAEESHSGQRSDLRQTESWPTIPPPPIRPGSHEAVELQSGRRAESRQIEHWPVIPPIRAVTSHRYKRGTSERKRMLLPEPDNSVV